MVRVYSCLIFTLVLTSFINSHVTHADEIESLKKVEHKYVCMITNKLFAEEQIEVDIEGKKYYGCCEMCKAKLSQDVNSRLSKDPVTGNTVDKALSVTAASSSGNVYYFENENNLKIFKQRN